MDIVVLLNILYSIAKLHSGFVISAPCSKPDILSFFFFSAFQLYYRLTGFVCVENCALIKPRYIFYALVFSILWSLNVVINQTLCYLFPAFDVFDMCYFCLCLLSLVHTLTNTFKGRLFILMTNVIPGWQQKKSNAVLLKALVPLFSSLSNGCISVKPQFHFSWKVNRQKKKKIFFFVQVQAHQF